MQTSIRHQVDTSLLTKIKEIEPFIGRTPIHPIHGLFNRKGVRIFAKKEWHQLSGSIKARAAFYIIKDAIQRGILTSDKVLLDATSGNTGIAYATIARQLGLRITLCLPENVSAERRSILQLLGVDIIFTSRFEGTDGAQSVAKELAVAQPDLYFYADQYQNSNNWKAHYHGTGYELIDGFPTITHFVCGLGTTGTFVGTGRRLKEFKPDIKLVALQPDIAMHGLEGWKHLDTALVPGIFDPNLANEMIEIETLESYEIIKAARKHEGLSLSPSSAANLAGALRLAENLDSGTILTVLPDNADKYSELTHKLFS